MELAALQRACWRPGAGAFAVTAAAGCIKKHMGHPLRGKASNFFTTCRNGGKKCSISVQVPGKGKRLFQALFCNILFLL